MTVGRRVVVMFAVEVDALTDCGRLCGEELESAESVLVDYNCRTPRYGLYGQGRDSLQ